MCPTIEYFRYTDTCAYMCSISCMVVSIAVDYHLSSSSSSPFSSSSSSPPLFILLHYLPISLPWFPVSVEELSINVSWRSWNTTSPRSHVGSCDSHIGSCDSHMALFGVYTPQWISIESPLHLVYSSLCLISVYNSNVHREVAVENIINLFWWKA